MSKPILARNEDATLFRALQGLRSWAGAESPSPEAPLLDAVLDDLDAVLGGCAALDDVSRLCTRLHHTFGRLLLAREGHHMLTERPPTRFVDSTEVRCAFPVESRESE